ncbi:MAG: thioredoxin family protein [Paenibacillus sp.]|jgi:thiol-disulfide isomerase/thioredoxin|nr:thioredoxin family protein [Paenibacillus sp.]
MLYFDVVNDASNRVWKVQANPNEEANVLERIASTEQFQEVTGSDKLTVVKYVTSWCPDCKNLDRFIGGIVTEHADKQWFEMDAEQFQEIAEANEVRGIPSLLVYRNGQKIAHLHSKFAKTPDQIRAYLDELPKE